MNPKGKTMIRTEHLNLPVGEAIFLDNGQSALKIKVGNKTDIISAESLLLQIIQRRTLEFQQRDPLHR